MNSHGEYHKWLGTRQDFSEENEKILSLPVHDKISKSYSMIIKRPKPINALYNVTRSNWRQYKYAYVI
jgi:hypothetical protein